MNILKFISRLFKRKNTIRYEVANDAFKHGLKMYQVMYRNLKRIDTI